MPAGPPGRIGWSAGLAGRLAVVLWGLLLLLAFALWGPGKPQGLAALVLAAVSLLGLLPTGLAGAIVPLCGVTLPVTQPLPGVQLFDFCSVGLCAWALALTLSSPARAVWDLHGPGKVMTAMLLAPLIALPLVVVSPLSFLGQYKNYVLVAGLFLSLRRIVPRSHSNVLLWIFPLVGSISAAQLLWRTRGLGALLSRLKFRNFYTGLGWGQSDYISAVLELCLCATFVLALVDRRVAARIVLAVAAAIMLQAFLILYSRAGLISMLLFVGALAWSYGRRRSLLVFAAVAALAGAGLATPQGQVFLQRFSDPQEYGSWYFRLMTWEAGLARFAAHPWTGIGLNQGRWQADIIGGESANSSFLDFLSEQGVAGGLVFLLIVVSAIRLARRIVPAGGGAVRLVRFASLGTIVAVVLHSLVEPTLTGHVMSVLFAYFMAWLTLQDSPRVAGEPGTR